MVQVRMEGFKKLHIGHNTDDMMRVIEKDDSNSSYTTDSEENCKKSNRSLRERIARSLETIQCHMIILAFVLFDSLLVVLEILVRQKIVHVDAADARFPLALHYLNLVILCLFLLEILIRIFAIRLDYFRTKMEIFDGLVVVLAFSFNIAFLKDPGLKSGVGLIILLRFWRVSKVIKVLLNSVRKQAERRLLRERRTREALEQELAKYREYCSAQEFEIECLQGLLRKHGVDYGKVERPVMGQQIDVVVEVNEVLSEKCALMQGQESPNSAIFVTDAST